MARRPTISNRQHLVNVLVNLPNVNVAVRYVLITGVFNTVVAGSRTGYSHTINQSTGPVAGTGIYNTFLHKINLAVWPHIANAHIPIAIGWAGTYPTGVGFRKKVYQRKPRNCKRILKNIAVKLYYPFPVHAVRRVTRVAYQHLALRGPRTIRRVVNHVTSSHG